MSTNLALLAPRLAQLSNMIHAIKDGMEDNLRELRFLEVRVARKERELVRHLDSYPPEHEQFAVIRDEILDTLAQLRTDLTRSAERANSSLEELESALEESMTIASGMSSQ